ncbi:Collectin-43 [Orchesella cincta]|uniref:Collectin-43 n=1 Tax=Orchesella cincta TaxID=48709 RepID=A0A1D2N251_ORCCI|nr:Collectin-43 [Orchesella cincta]
MKSLWKLALLGIVCAIGVSAQRSRTSATTRLATPTTTPEPRFLALPDPVKCSRRPKEFFYEGHWYFFSGNTTRYRNSEVDWLEARNACREYCMDTVSMESQEENDIIFQLIKSGNLKYIWSSGRLCDFKGCKERPDLQPVTVNGWFWSGSGTKMASTNSIPKGWDYQPWSFTGNNKRAQPDNAEYDINGTPESCLAVLNNVYKDGVHWHDVACYHPKAFVCEDSDELLRYARATNPNLPI